MIQHKFTRSVFCLTKNDNVTKRIYKYISCFYNLVSSILLIWKIHDFFKVLYLGLVFFFNSKILFCYVAKKTSTINTLEALTMVESGHNTEKCWTGGERRLGFELTSFGVLGNSIFLCFHSLTCKTVVRVSNHI